MIIDGHAHCAGDFLDSSNIIKILNKNNVDYVVLAGTSEINSEKNRDLSLFSKFIDIYPNNFIYIANKIIRIVNSINKSAQKIDLGNEYVYNLVKQYPNRIIQFYWTNPSEENIFAKINDKYAQYNFKGLKLHKCITKFDFNSQSLSDIADWAKEKDIPIFIHLCSKKDVIDMIEFITRHPDTKFIIAHLIGLDIFIDKNINSSNVFFDISCPQLVTKDNIVLAVNKFGAEKIILGSDTPYGNDNLETCISRIQNLNLSDKEKDLILGDNMKALLKL